jgi:hypothetical protein
MRPDFCRIAFAICAVVWHSPSNAHAYRLYVVKELAFQRRCFYSAKTAILTCFINHCQLLGLLLFSLLSCWLALTALPLLFSSEACDSDMHSSQSSTPGSNFLRVSFFL